MNNYGTHISFKTVWIILVYVFFVVMLSACSETEQTHKSIALILPESENPFWLRLQKGAQKAAQESGVKLQILSKEGKDVSQQIEVLKEAISEKPNGLLIVPAETDDSQLVSAVEGIGLPVVVLDRPLTITIPKSDNILTDIRFDGMRGGMKIGEWVSAQLAPKGNILILYDESPTGEEHCKDFIKGLFGSDQQKENCKDYNGQEKEGIKILDIQSAKDKAGADQQTKEWLNNFTQIDVILAANDQMVSGAADAVWKAGRKDIIITGLEKNVLILYDESPTGEERCKGFIKGLFGLDQLKENCKYYNGQPLKKGIKILDIKSAHYKRVEAYEQTEKWLRIFPQIDAILVVNDQMALGASDAVWKAGRKNIIITGIDGIDAVLQEIRDDNIHATINQKAFDEGYIALHLMLAHLEYLEYEKEAEKAEKAEKAKKVQSSVQKVVEKVGKNQAQVAVGKILEGKEWQKELCGDDGVLQDTGVCPAQNTEGNQNNGETDQTVQLWKTPLIDKNYIKNCILGEPNLVNVVYTGITVHEITDFNEKDFTVSLDFTLWFWYKDIDDPQDIIFLNAVEPIKLLKQKSSLHTIQKFFNSFNKKGEGTSVIEIEPNTTEDKDKDGFRYSAYRIKMRFKANFLPNQTGQQPVLGENAIGLAFRHRKKNLNELLYTPDFLGMGWYKKGLKEQVNDLKVFQLHSNQFIRNAIIFHDIMDIDIPGKPVIEDSSKTDNIFTTAEFSRFTLAIYIEDFSQHFWHLFFDFYEESYFYKEFDYSTLKLFLFCLFCLFCLLAIIYVGKKNLRKYWFWISTRIKVLWHYYTSKFLSKHFSAKGRVLWHNIYTYTVKYLLKPVVWLGVLLLIGGILVVFSILLLSLENHVVQDFSKYMEYEELRLIVLFFGLLWWLIPASLLVLAINLFIWRPLEAKTGQNVPILVRRAITFIIFMLASFGIIAFIFNYPLTGLLATSGLFAMIIGLAVQLNLSNIFSGLALSIEQPFKIGDRVKIGDFDEGEVVEMSWRSTKIRTKDNIIVYIPNNPIAENSIHNYSFSEKQ